MMNAVEKQQLNRITHWPDEIINRNYWGSVSSQITFTLSFLRRTFSHLSMRSWRSASIGWVVVMKATICSVG